jgi:type II secretory pathway predicted ATPase ExeA
MYELFYGLRERPFDLSPNPRYLLLMPAHREALSTLEYALTTRKGLTVLLGEAGTGKTTLVRKALSLALYPGGTVADTWVYMNNPTLTRGEFFELLASRFALSPESARSKTRFLAELESVLHKRSRQGVVPGLIIDEAQSLPWELLEEIRLLANIESDTEKLLPVILAAQPELGARLNEPDLRQLKQRVALRCTISPLDLRQTASYIAGRIKLAGGSPTALFTSAAVLVIFRASRGIPRAISAICDNALIGGFAADRRPVGEEIVREVCRDLDLELPAAGMDAGRSAPLGPAHPSRYRIEVGALSPDRM